MNRSLMAKAAYLVLAGTLLLYALLFWQERSLIARGYPNFISFYSAGLMVREGLGHRLYDDELQYQVQRRVSPDVNTHQGPLPYYHPPFEALALAPLTLFSYPVAFVMWDLLNIVMLALVPLVLRPHIAILRQKSPVVWWLGLLAFFPIFSALLQGQDVILLLLLQSVAFAALKRRSDFLSGCWLGLGIFRPQLIVPLVVVILLGWKRYRVFVGFFTICLCLGSISLAIVGKKQISHYPDYVLHQERDSSDPAMMPAIMPNIRGLLAGWRESAQFPEVLNVAVLMLSLVLILWAIMTSWKYWDSEMEWHFALATTVAVLIGYHVFAYDLIFLIIPLFTALNLAARGVFRVSSDPMFLIPVGLLLLEPFYVMFSFRMIHANLLALVLLFALWGIQRRLKEQSQRLRGENSSIATIDSSGSAKG